MTGCFVPPEVIPEMTSGVRWLVASPILKHCERPGFRHKSRPLCLTTDGEIGSE